MARRARSDAGMVTAEFATAMPAIVLILVMACSVLGFAIDEIRCLDAARAAARSASRGDSAAQTRLVAQRLAPPEASVTISGGDVVRVEVRAPARRIGGWLPTGIDPQARAEVPRETPR